MTLHPALAATAAALAVGLVSCAADPAASTAAAPASAASGAQTAQADPNARKQVCVREQPVGSAIPITRCHYEDDPVHRAMDLDDFRQKIYQNTRATPAGGG
jgi:hypothetical protein